MNDHATDNKQFTELIHEVLRERSIRTEEILHLAASHYQCGVETSTQWTASTEGYVLEITFTLAPDLPPYSIRETEGVVTQYVAREEGGQGPA